MYQEGFSPIVALQLFSYGRKEAKFYNGVIFTNGLIDGYTRDLRIRSW